VHLDGHVEVDDAYYSAPPGNIARELLAQWDGERVRLLDPRTGELPREHRAQERGRHRTHVDNRPTKTPSSTESVLSRGHSEQVPVGLT